MTADLAVGLRAWIRGHDPHVGAAVELLITHDVWLRRADFRDRFVRDSADGPWIDFYALTRAVDSGDLPGASSTETGVLLLAADLGSDCWRTSRMSDTNAALVRQAITTATR